MENGGGAGQARCLSATVRPLLKLACVCKRGMIKRSSRKVLTVAPGLWGSRLLGTAAHARVPPCRAWERRRIEFAGRGSGPTRRCSGGKLLGRGTRRSGGQDAGGELGVNLSSGSRGSGGSSRRRYSQRGPGGCRCTAAARGPPPPDRAAASGSRAPLMPCRGQLASRRARVEQRPHGPCLRCRSELRRLWVRITEVAPCAFPSLRMLLWLLPFRGS